jgi:hypothetical protein
VGVGGWRSNNSLTTHPWEHMLDDLLELANINPGEL